MARTLEGLTVHANCYYFENKVREKLILYPAKSKRVGEFFSLRSLDTLHAKLMYIMLHAVYMYIGCLPTATQYKIQCIIMSLLLLDVKMRRNDALCRVGKHPLYL